MSKRNLTAVAHFVESHGCAAIMHMVQPYIELSWEDSSQPPPVHSKIRLYLASACIRPKSSYARKLVTAISSGVFDLLDPVLERHSFDDVGEMA